MLYNKRREISFILERIWFSICSCFFKHPTEWDIFDTIRCSLPLVDTCYCLQTVYLQEHSSWDSRCWWSREKVCIPSAQLIIPMIEIEIYMICIVSIILLLKFFFCCWMLVKPFTVILLLVFPTLVSAVSVYCCHKIGRRYDCISIFFL